MSKFENQNIREEVNRELKRYKKACYNMKIAYFELLKKLKNEMEYNRLLESETRYLTKKLDDAEKKYLESKLDVTPGKNKYEG